MHAFRNLSIRTKLMSSMVSCLLLFVAISTTLGFVLTGASLRERVVGQELPAVVGEIRNDILRQIGTPLAMARSVAGNSFVLDWEAAGEPEDGNAAWARYAQAVGVLGLGQHGPVFRRAGTDAQAGAQGPG